MAHEIDKEKLTAYTDGELHDAERDAVKTHLDKCPQCLAYLGTIAMAREQFKKAGAEKLPPAVAKAALDRNVKKETPRERWQYVVALTAIVALMLVGGMLAKRLMPGLFSQIQGMISGAANNLGQ